MADDLYLDNHACRLCGRYCPSGIARDNHARKHQREGLVKIKGWGGPDGARRFEIISFDSITNAGLRVVIPRSRART